MPGVGPCERYTTLSATLPGSAPVAATAVGWWNALQQQQGQTQHPSLYAASRSHCCNTTHTEWRPCRMTQRWLCHCTCMLHMCNLLPPRAFTTTNVENECCTMERLLVNSHCNEAAAQPMACTGAPNTHLSILACLCHHFVTAMLPVWPAAHLQCLC